MRVSLPPGRAKVHWTVGVSSLAAIILMGCGGEGGPTPTSTPTPTPRPVSSVLNDASPPSVPAEVPGGAAGFSHFVFEQVGDTVITSLVEGPRGAQVRTVLSLAALRKLLVSGDPVPEELGMNRKDLDVLVGQLETVRAATEKYRDISVAVEEGYLQATDVVPNMGAHFIHLGRVMDGVLNAEEPEILLYDQDETGDWRLRGTSFVLPRELVGDEHPEGFAGPLDNWHVHYQLCISPELNSRTATGDSCRASGGFHLPTYGWMIHAWVHDDNPMGVFSMWNPNIPPLAPVQTIRDRREGGVLPVEAGERSSAGLASGSSKVTIENFEHSTIETIVGQSITWVNADGVPHTVTAGASGVGSGGFDSDLLGPGQTFTKRFDRPGTFSFTCAIHPQMNGTIVVGSGQE